MRQIKMASKPLLVLSFLLMITGGEARAQAPAPPEWQPAQISILKHWISKAAEDALPILPTDELNAAMNAADTAKIDREATSLALRLARMHLLGNASKSARTGWHIDDSDAAIDLDARLAKSLADRNVERFFLGLRPLHPDYVALRAAFASETDMDRREAIARNMERWRWMPRSLGTDYVLVNAAMFEARLWKHGEQAESWRVIVGKKSTPTPVFSATIKGVILNPWWVVPASIVREKHGYFPASRGYVRSGGQVMQKPGPNNALGQMKLDMPNPYTVYMHDTPGKQLFEEEKRAFSHGCIRVHNALDVASTLLEGVKTREQIDAIVATRKTTKIPLPRSLPVYVTYFTAAPADDGSIAYPEDIYGRDKRLGEIAVPSAGCAA